MILNPLYLIDATGELYIIEAVTRVDNDRTTFSMTSESGSGGGQHYFQPRSEAQQKLLDLWKTYHLKDVTNIDIEEMYNDIYESVRKEIVEEAAQYCDEATKALEDLTDEHKAAAVIQEYIHEHTSVTPSISLILHDLKYDADSHTASSLGWDFYVGTEEELYDEAEKYLIEDRELWVEAVKAGSTDKGLHEWAENVSTWDGWDVTLDRMWGYGVDMSFADKTHLCCCCR